MINFLPIFLIFITLSHGHCPTECFCVRKHVDCSFRGLYSPPIDIPRSTTFLELQGNHLTNISTEHFEALKRLEILDLSDNEITTIDVAAFSSFSKINILTLRKNNLSRIPKAIHTLPLAKLDLRSNKISTVSVEDMNYLRTIPTVDLSRNEIVTIGVAVDNGTLPKASVIRKIDLSANRLQKLRPRTFSHLESLVSLKLSRNELENLDPEVFRGLQQLTNLDLSRNKIHWLPSLLFNHLSQLTNLTLARNEISRLHDGVFFGCDRLLNLNLSNNQVHNISGGLLFGLHELQTLDLSSNSIGWFDPFVWQDVPKLKFLSLSDNRLRSLPSASFRKLPNLTTLDLSNNSIEVLHKTAMSGLHRLYSLDLSSNTLAVCVEDGAVLYNTSLPYLKQLKFTNNNLRVLPTRAFDRFPALEILDLRDNPIATMHANSFEPLRLKELYLNTSSLLCDCKLDWWSKWVFSSGLNRSLISARCSHPIPLADIEVIAIDVANLTCIDDSPRPRILLHPPTQVKSLVGSEARFTCSGYGQYPIVLAWRVMDAGKTRDLHEDQNTRIVVNRTDTVNGTKNGQELLTGELVLSEVELADRAEYQCIVRNRFGTDYSQRSYLEVHQKPTFTKEPDDITLLVGQNAGIICSATGVPQPVVKWQKDGGDTFPASAERRLHVRPNDDHLYVVKVKAEDAGVYTCHASNDAGHVMASATVRVYDNNFRSSLSDVSVPEGDTVLLDCMVGLVDGQHMRWIRTNVEGEETQVITTPRITLRANNQLLVIVKVAPTDDALYTCQLWAGSHLLNQQSAKVMVMSSKQETVPQTMSVVYARTPTNMEFSLIVTMSLVLLGFLIVWLAWSLLFYRRSSLSNRYSYRTIPLQPRAV